MDAKNTETLEKVIMNSGKPINIGDTVFFIKSENNWTKPYVRKRHHVPETRSVILKGKVTDIHKDEFKALLTDNNGFEKDGEEYVFHKNSLLCDQDFKDIKRLGQWKQDPSSNP